jgi:hypothetical protein
MFDYLSCVYSRNTFTTPASLGVGQAMALLCVDSENITVAATGALVTRNANDNPSSFPCAGRR